MGILSNPRPPNHQNSCYTLLNPGRVGSSRGFGYLSSSARTRSTIVSTSRHSMAIGMATRIQGDFPPIRPHLLCTSTARRSFQRPADRRLNLPSRSSSPLPHAQRRRNHSISLRMNAEPGFALRRLTVLGLFAGLFWITARLRDQLRPNREAAGRHRQDCRGVHPPSQGRGDELFRAVPLP